MAAEQTGRDVCYRPTDDSICSREQMALTDFSFRLGSYSYTSEPGTDDEDNTRQEAELLMSLCASSPTKISTNDAELETVSSSSSASEASVPSEDSSHASRRDSFSFICPSLSLETVTSSSCNNSTTSSLATGADDSPCCSPQRTCSVSSIPTQKSVDTDSSTMTPGVLFGRHLTVDDRDALRLSADAMARNVLHSFQKAIDWRIRTWVKSMSSTLVRMEKSMLGQGASEEQLKTLLETSEAQLIVTLHGIANQIHVSGVGTSFQVLPQRVEEKKDVEPVLKKQRVDKDDETPKAKLEEEGDYQYTVAHALVFECVVDLLTPAGYSEVTLEVPGTIEGTFTSAGHDMDNMTSVIVDLDTCMLAAMVEKACRKIVRASAETAMQPPEPLPSMDLPEIDTHCEESTSSPPTTAEVLGLLTPPPSREVSDDITAETVRAALITPREQIISSTPATTTQDYLSSRRVLRPIPDDLEERGPRRISPQPNSPELISGGSGKTSAFPFTLHTPKVKDVWTTSTSALVSPPLKEPTYHEVPDNGPSLPMLVEVACRAFRGST